MMDDTTRRLNALFDLKILDTPPEPEFDDIVHLARTFCATPVALVSLVAVERQWFKAKVGFEPCETPIGQSVCAFALKADELLVIPDLTLDPRTRDNTLVTADPNIRFYAGAVLKNPDGVPIGSLCVIDGKPRPEGLTTEQREALLALARQTVALMVLRRATLHRDDALLQLRRAGLASLDRARIEEAAADRLRLAEARTRAAQEAGRVGAFEVDIATGRAMVSPEFCRLFGFPMTDQMPAAAIEATIIPEDQHLSSTAQSRRDGTAPVETEYRIRRADDSSLRWISRRGAFEWDRQGNPVRWLGVVQDISERKLGEARGVALLALGDELRDAESVVEVVDIASRLLGETLSVSRAGYIAIDLPGGVIDIERGWADVGTQGVSGLYPLKTFEKTIQELEDGVPLAISNIPSAVWLGADLGGYAAIDTRAMIKVPLVRRRELVGALFVHNTLPRTWSPAEIKFVEAVADRAYAAIAKVAAESQQRLLNGELSHRLKNTLAMVQAIAGQTLRGAGDKAAVHAFEERLIALSNAHDILLQESWAAASIRSIIEGVLKVQGCAARTDVSGPDIKCGPKATLSISMLLHELGTNATKYGALSVESGRVTLTWAVDAEAPQPILAMTWAEHGGPPAVVPTRRGFGSRLISMGIAGAGRADLTYATTGFVAQFRAPLSVIAET